MGKRKRLTADDWETIRAERETGVSFRALADKWGITHQAIQRRSKREGWGDGQDLSQAIRRKVAEKVAGVVAGVNPKKRAQAINAAAARGAEVVARHKQDWEDHHQRFTVNGVADDFDLGKSAKISAEMLAIRQKAERAAHGLDDRAEGPVTVSWTNV
ncbi:MAG: hypothetical protein RBR42_05010 [Desulfomicrobium sp.]|nr:hypothetical protein [Desulfomicrobium sp.]